MGLNTLTIVLGLLVAGVSVSTADSVAPPRDRIIESANQRYRLVVLQGGEGTSNQNDDLRKLYPQAGAYRTGSFKLLWTLPHYFGEILLAGDGVHAVMVDRFPHASPNSPRGDRGVEFFARGRSLRRYTIDEIIGPRAKAKRTVSHYLWVNRVALDPTEKYLDLDTFGGPRRFEVATGARVTPP
jgi:hypothetical protein